MIDRDPTDGLVVSLGHKELPHWWSTELMAVIGAAATDKEKALLSVLDEDVSPLTAGGLRARAEDDVAELIGNQKIAAPGRARVEATYTEPGQLGSYTGLRAWHAQWEDVSTPLGTRQRVDFLDT